VWEPFLRVSSSSHWRKNVKLTFVQIRHERSELIRLLHVSRADALQLLQIAPDLVEQFLARRGFSSEEASKR